MTNKELIDACNAYWGRTHTCEGCPFDNACNIFKKKHGTTPYRENEYNKGRFYTDEVIE